MDAFRRQSRAVSIHAPRAGRDKRWIKQNSIRSGFNPRAPRGARPRSTSAFAVVCVFQSTRPARGATVGSGVGQCVGRVSIHAPRAGRDRGHRHKVGFGEVSIHAPRAGRDCGVLFNGGGGGVSIHAPRAGRDFSAFVFPTAISSFNPRAPRGARHRPAESPSVRCCFNPRAPRGARPFPIVAHTFSSWFQSTRPARGATPPVCPRARPLRVSIHAPRAGRDQPSRTAWWSPYSFQSTRPARGATGSWRPSRLWTPVSIHAPRAGRDELADPLTTIDIVSIHAPRAGRDKASNAMPKTS